VSSHDDLDEIGALENFGNATHLGNVPQSNSLGVTSPVTVRELDDGSKLSEIEGQHDSEERKAADEPRALFAPQAVPAVRAVQRAPDLVSPENGASRARVNPTFEWTNVPRATSYVMQLFADNPDNAINRRRYVVKPDAGGTTRFTLDEADHDNDPLTYGRKYYWNVRGRDSEGLGPVSEKWSFTTRVAPVTTAPTPVRPVNGATGTSLTPTFEWTNPENVLQSIRWQRGRDWNWGSPSSQVLPRCHRIDWELN
jgi:hypothetical protein